MLAENKGNMKLLIKKWNYNFNKPCNLTLIVSYRCGHYGQLYSILIIIFLLSIHCGYLYFIWRALMLSNITIKVSGKILATLTSPESDMIVNETFCFLCVWGFFPLYFISVYLNEELEWMLTRKNGMDCADNSAFTFTFMDPFFALIFASELCHLVSLAFRHFVAYNH